MHLCVVKCIALNCILVIYHHNIVHSLMQLDLVNLYCSLSFVLMDFENSKGDDILADTLKLFT